MNVEQLNHLYDKAESVLEKHFAEQRSNLRLKAGFHYKRETWREMNRRVAESKLSTEIKIRITKNHTHVISNNIQNSILSLAPDVGIFPRNKQEFQDQKAAELYASVWEDIKDSSSYKEWKRGCLSDYVNIGEVWAKVFFDPDQGEIKGWEMEVDPETGLPLGSEEEATPIYAGKIVFERLFGFNVLTNPEAKSFHESDIIVRKHIPLADLKARYKDDKEKLGYLEAVKDETFKVFDGMSGDYHDTKDMVMVREFYFRPCAKYPRGYYFYATSLGILEEGTLDLGFPIFFKGYDDLPTTPRATSFIKQIKPNQIEINRCASQIVLHSITLGDDKVFFQAGSKLSNANYYPGLRAFHYTGNEPTVVQGRTGAQFIDWMNFNVEEMYRIANVPEHREEKVEREDPQAYLFRSLKDKKKFSLYAEKFEEFLRECCEFALENARAYYSDDMLIPALGREEYVNIAEFRGAPKVRHMIKVIPKTDDAETVMGKAIFWQQVLQYTGSNLNPQQIGTVVRSLPFLNDEKAVEEFTLDTDNADNDILALDRGEEVPIYWNDNHEYIVQKLQARTKRRDFQFLPPNVQMLYQHTIKQHEEMIQQRVMATQRLQQGFIPTDGPAVKIQMYHQDPMKPDRLSLIKIPAKSVEWLLQQLNSQGNTQAMINALSPEVQADLGLMMPAQQPQGLQPISLGG